MLGIKALFVFEGGTNYIRSETLVQANSPLPMNDYTEESCSIFF